MDDRGADESPYLLRGERDVIRLRNPTEDKRALRRMLTSADPPSRLQFLLKVSKSCKSPPFCELGYLAALLRLLLPVSSGSLRWNLGSCSCFPSGKVVFLEQDCLYP